jgi:hypothetical protein
LFFLKIVHLKLNNKNNLKINQIKLKRKTMKEKGYFTDGVVVGFEPETEICSKEPHFKTIQEVNHDFRNPRPDRCSINRIIEAEGEEIFFLGDCNCGYCHLITKNESNKSEANFDISFARLLKPIFIKMRLNEINDFLFSKCIPDEIRNAILKTNKREHKPVVIFKNKNKENTAALCCCLKFHPWQGNQMHELFSIDSSKVLELIESNESFKQQLTKIYNEKNPGNYY